MNQFTNFTPESFDLTKLSLKIPGRQFKVGPQVSDEIDIIQTSVELSIFEHISMPYLTAKLVLVDDFGLLDFPGIEGTEKIVIEFGYPATLLRYADRFGIGLEEHVHEPGERHLWPDRHGARV